MNAGELRKLIDGMPDEAPVPIYVAYGDVVNKYTFVRLDRVTTEPLPGLLKEQGAPSGINIAISIVGADEIEDEEEEDEGLDGGHLERGGEV